MSDILYPVWRFHATHPACIVTDEAADRALGPGWVSNPGQLPTPTTTTSGGRMTDKPTQLPVEPPTMTPDPPSRPDRPGINPDPDRDRIEHHEPGDRRPHPEPPIAEPPPARPVTPTQPIAEPPPPARPKKK